MKMQGSYWIAHLPIGRVRMLAQETIDSSIMTRELSMIATRHASAFSQPWSLSHEDAMIHGSQNYG